MDVAPYFIPTLLLIFHIYLVIVAQNFTLSLWILYVLIPLLDYLLPIDHSNLNDVDARIFEKDWRFTVPLYLFWGIDFAFHFHMVYMMGKGKIALSCLQYFMLVLGNAQYGGINATIGHELLHRRNIRDKVLGTLSYSKMIYSHYFIQHVRSHHKIVGTPGDSSTGRYGESVFAYYLRALPQGFIEVWHFESERLTREKKSSYSPLENRLIWFNILHIVYLAAVFSIFGYDGLKYHLIYSLTVVLIFEAVNYIEHYALVRKIDANGNYESINIKHSWNAPQVLTNYLLFKLQRHSDHHANVYKPYQILNSYPESPMLPYGYSVSLILALIPPVWFRVLDPMAIATNKDEKLSEKQKSQIEQIVKTTLIVTSSLMTYLLIL
ncbi:fatty acid desaturase family protein [Stylonychia lemnae]|uniref:Fatty acid desaturase family protein n=1 Tax=Stylonychia lemnae TaxID=5949 RepID=A0A078AFX9_STYLE|nr:fatty acid desaturase family protein [Stylonychia lemnae]|eukprot:CDW81200.1 fatty acid desaturase family protein [Stylonychia lemnae]